MESLSISTSTTIDASKQPFNLSPLVRRCTAVLQNTVLEHVNNIIREKTIATPALFSHQENKENTCRSVIVHWPTVESRMTEIIRKELAELTGNGTILNKTKIISSPLTKRHLDFDSPLASELEKSNFESPVPKPKDQFFKVPVPINRAVKRLKESERQSISVGTSPIKVRRSMRLSMKGPAPDTIAPTAAPRYKLLQLANRLTETTASNCNFSSPFKPTRRSVRLSMKCVTAPSFSHVLPTPKPRPVAEEDASFESDFLPIPAPRMSMIKIKTPAKKKKTMHKNVELKWSTPKKISSCSHKKHRLRTLHLLNFGSQRDLQSLATVGVKTALQIVTYRSLNGEFKNFNDIKKIPTWGNKKFEKFMLANQLL